MIYQIKRGIGVTLVASVFLIIFVSFLRVPEHPAAITKDLQPEVYLGDTEATVSPQF
jgi:hypothetical protein